MTGIKVFQGILRSKSDHQLLSLGLTVARFFAASFRLALEESHHFLAFGLLSFLTGGERVAAGQLPVNPRCSSWRRKNNRNNVWFDCVPAWKEARDR